MGQYQHVNAEIWLNNHECYNSKEELEEEIQETRESMDRYKRELFGLCCGDAKNLLHCHDGSYPMNPIDVLTTRFDEIMEFYTECVERNMRREYVRDNWEQVEEQLAEQRREREEHRKQMEQYGREWDEKKYKEQENKDSDAPSMEEIDATAEKIRQIQESK